jgi:hypothetical protein
VIFVEYACALPRCGHHRSFERAWCVACQGLCRAGDRSRRAWPRPPTPRRDGPGLRDEGREGEGWCDRCNGRERNDSVSLPVRHRAPGRSPDCQRRYLWWPRPGMSLRRHRRGYATDRRESARRHRHYRAAPFRAFCWRRRGRVAVIVSIAAYLGPPYSPGYCASKAGLRAYGEALRPRLEPRGVGVTIVCPGFFDSLMTDRFEGPTPLRVNGDVAARIVKQGIDRGRRRVAFPWLLVLGLQFRFRARDYWRCHPSALPVPDPLGLSRR